MHQHEMNLNIRYDAPEEVWDVIVQRIYEQADGWLGYDTNGIPYWYSFDRDEKHILASVEPSGLHFSGLIDSDEWATWVKRLKEIATRELGYKVGEIELGEVDF